jgi:hypothetical protein
MINYSSPPVYSPTDTVEHGSSTSTAPSHVEEFLACSTLKAHFGKGSPWSHINLVLRRGEEYWVLLTCLLLSLCMLHVEHASWEWLFSWIAWKARDKCKVGIQWRSLKQYSTWWRWRGWVWVPFVGIGNFLSTRGKLEESLLTVLCLVFIAWVKAGLIWGVHRFLRLWEKGAGLSEVLSEGLSEIGQYSKSERSCSWRKSIGLLLWRPHD